MEIALKIKAKNGFLQRFIEERGWTQAEFGRRVGINQNSICKYFNMTGYPNKYTIEIICRFVGETKEVIFPELLKNEDFLELDKKTTFYKRIDPDRILGGEGLEALPAPEDDESDIERQEAIDRVESVLDTLTYREREIIKMRFGIIEGTTCTLEEAGKKLNITRTRVNQLEKRALRKLRHPARSRKLEGFLA